MGKLEQNLMMTETKSLLRKDVHTMAGCRHGCRASRQGGMAGFRRSIFLGLAQRRARPVRCLQSGNGADPAASSDPDPRGHAIGILRRAEKRGKTLPELLMRALKAVADLEPTSTSERRMKHQWRLRRLATLITVKDWVRYATAGADVDPGSENLIVSPEIARCVATWGVWPHADDRR